MDTITKVSKYLEIPKSKLHKAIRVDSVSHCVSFALKDAIGKSRTCKSHILVESGLHSIINMCKVLEKNGIIDLSIVETSNIGNITDYEINKYIIRTSRLLICSHINPSTLVENNVKNVNKIPILMLIDHRMQCKSLPSVDHIVINLPINGLVFYIGKYEIQKTAKPEPSLKLLDDMKSKLVLAEKYKTVYMNKLTGIVGCMSLESFNAMYDHAVCRLMCIVIGNSIGAVALSFVSVYNKKRIRLSFAVNNNITSPKINPFVKLGYSLIDFKSCDNLQQLSEWIKKTSHELSQQYPRIREEIKISKLCIKKNSSKKTDKRVRFCSRLCFTPVEKHKSTYPKSSLKRKSKYR